MTATVFDTYGLGESLLPLTRSCEMWHDKCNNFQHNCSTSHYIDPMANTDEEYACWWCRERRWAFEGTGIDADAWIPLPEMTDDGFICPITGNVPEPEAV